MITSTTRLSDDKKVCTCLSIYQISCTNKDIDQVSDHASLATKIDPKEAAARKAAEEATKKALEKKRVEDAAAKKEEKSNAAADQKKKEEEAALAAKKKKEEEAALAAKKKKEEEAKAKVTNCKQLRVNLFSCESNSSIYCYS